MLLPVYKSSSTHTTSNLRRLQSYGQFDFHLLWGGKMLFVNSESNCVKKNVQLKHKEERRAIPSNVCLISSLRMAVCSCGTHGNQINQPQE